VILTKVSSVIYRLGRKPDPWSAPDWALAGADGTFGNRFDDPDALYRVLYASSQRVGCFLETLGRFRVDPKLLAELAEIEGEDDYCPLGEVPLEWVERRVMGVASARGEYADVCSSEWISRLRIVLAGHLGKFGLADLDASALQMTAPRNVTQLVSRIVFSNGLAGIYYRSKYGHDVENWALFEPFQINVQDPETIDEDAAPRSWEKSSVG
jgi:RES domain-containing protein